MTIDIFIVIFLECLIFGVGYCIGTLSAMERYLKWEREKEKEDINEP